MRRDLKPILAILAVVVAAVVIVALAGCGSTKQSVDPKAINTAPADVIAMPRGFRNVAASCDGTTRVYSASRGEFAETAGSVSSDDNHKKCGGTGEDDGGSP